MLIAVGYLLVIVVSLVIGTFAFSNRNDIGYYAAMMISIVATVATFAPASLHSTLVACVISWLCATVMHLRSGEKISFLTIPLRVLGCAGAVWSAALLLMYLAR